MRLLSRLKMLEDVPNDNVVFLGFRFVLKAKIEISPLLVFSKIFEQKYIINVKSPLVLQNFTIARKSGNIQLAY